MNILDEIKDAFASLQKGQSRYIEECDARTFMFMDGSYGVGIRFEKEQKVAEDFANVKFYTTELELGDEQQKFLLLTSSLIGLRNEFASVCADFIDLGLQDVNRQMILEDPFTWWMSWRELLGNAVKNPLVHSILGEMFSVKHLAQEGTHVKWKPTDFSTHDLESDTVAYEVKSTTSKYQQIISVNSQFQITSARDDMHLILCRFEKSPLGVSVDMLIEDLITIGYDRGELDREVEAVGFAEGSLARSEKYKLLEMRKYPVDDKFPGQEVMEFIKSLDDPSVKSLTFEVDLTNTDYEKVNVDLL
ncbi:hypothetical protein N780_08565 [Pontibacillus chungwhensis BH030062]|uniref:PD-(D/E)XK motif protein n=1 Tax=Pontibacillus chungwhensis BH030062 TaxID=1385513 RepID=A0A0A2USQ1_9BACI|nr:PD-(D/E)XK motif protein [Pontibacillus chungwhensis]KGP91317.1 hypothetical protein N780_08565 [Pontibacillus chungwhensis BH030062]